MSKIALEGNASGTGTFTIASPNSNNNRTLNLPDNTGTILTTGAIVTEAQGGTGTTTGYYGFKNRIINGAMMIDQRNAGASVTVNTGNQTFCVDRWWGQGTASAGVFTLQRSTIAPTGFVNSLLATVTTVDSSLASTDLYDISQIIEGFNVADLGWGTANAQPVTLSFWVRSSVTGTFGGAYGNSAVNRSYPFTYTISAANTWEQKSVTVPGDTSGTWLTDNGIGIRVYFGLGLGSTYSGTAGAWSGSFFISATGATNLMATNGATFYITGVQLERGSTATSFDFRPYGTELMLCQRYYQEIGASADNVVVYQTYSNAVTTYYLPMAFPVPMRAAPTGTVAGTWTTATVSAFSVTAGTNSFRLNITSTGAGNVIVQNNGAGSKLTFAIEL